jgi:hypothetical protein
MRLFLFCQIFVALNFISLLVSAGEVPVPQCPQKLAVSQSISSSVEDDWKIVNSNNTHWLSGIGISAGEYPTEQTGFEISTKTKKLSKGDLIYFYDYVVPLPSGVHDYWIVCGYMNANTFLVHRIPEDVVRCEIKRINDITNSGKITVKCFDTPRDTK